LLEDTLREQVLLALPLKTIAARIARFMPALRQEFE